MKLLVDIGNTQIKSALFDGARYQAHNAFVHRNSTLTRQEMYRTLWQALSPPGQMLVSNVAGKSFASSIIEWARAQWQITPTIVQTSATAGGLQNGYTATETLGSDRWLAMISAWQRRKKGCCVIDCGTAMTIDVINDAGSHMGGIICPSKQVMEQAIRHTLPHLGTSEAINADVLLGQSTAACLGIGYHLSNIALIEYVLRQVEKKMLIQPQGFITGGNAEDILLRLNRKSFLHTPHLVLEGLTHFNAMS